MIQVMMGFVLSLSGASYIENNQPTNTELVTITNTKNSEQQDSSEKNEQNEDNIYVHTATENNKIILLAAIISVSCFFFLILAIVIIFVTKQKIKNKKLFNDLIKY